MGSPEYGLDPIGHLDDDVHTRRVNRLPVFGPLSALAETVSRERVDVVVVAIPSMPPVELATLLRSAVRSGARVRYLPSFHAALLDTDELVVADIRDRSRMRQVFATLRPQIVFHAAAHKHLPLLERHPCEGVKSNVLGTQHLVEAAVEYGTERFVLISTDKAA